jgi:CelD/BcsL family acetyltransferase involved in cellulose biosynthesis
VEDLLKLGPAWERLYEEDACADVFAHIDYYCAWWEHFGHVGDHATLVTHRGLRSVSVQIRSAQMHVLAVEDNGRTVGIVPLVLLLGRWNHLPVRILAPAINDHSPRGGVLSARLTDDAFRALAEHVSNSPDWDMMILDGIRLDSGFARKFSNAVVRCGLKVVQQRSWTHTFLALNGTWDEFLVTQGRHFRKRIYQGRRAVEKLGATTAERYAGSDVRQGMQLFVEIDRSSWKATDGESLAFHPKLAAYYEELAVRLAAKDSSEIWILKIGGEPAAGYLCLRKGDVLYTFKTSHSESFARAKVSPGNDLLARIIESCWERGFQGVDFVGTAAFVERWTSERREFDHVMIYHRRLYPSLVRFSESLRGRAARATRALGHATKQWRHRGQEQGNGSGEVSPASTESS